VAESSVTVSTFRPAVPGVAVVSSCSTIVSSCSFGSKDVPKEAGVGIGVNGYNRIIN